MSFAADTWTTEVSVERYVQSDATASTDVTLTQVTALAESVADRIAATIATRCNGYSVTPGTAPSDAQLAQLLDDWNAVWTGELWWMVYATKKAPKRSEFLEMLESKRRGWTEATVAYINSTLATVLGESVFDTDVTAASRTAVEEPDFAFEMEDKF